MLGAIQAGASLRKTTTSDRSKAPGAGSVIGDASPPVRAPIAAPVERDHAEPDTSFDQSSTAPKSLESGLKPGNPNRQSVDWYGGLAADTYPSPTFPSQQNGQLPTMQEESEDEAFIDAKQEVKETNGALQDDSPEDEFNMTACKPSIYLPARPITEWAMLVLFQLSVLVHCILTMLSDRKTLVSAKIS